MSSGTAGGPSSDPATEERNQKTLDIDVVPTLEMLRLLNSEDALVPAAVEKVLPLLAELVDAAADRVRRGGLLHYFGAGTSGRIAMLDAAELPPTFGVDRSFATAHVAGGDDAARGPVEDAEDDTRAGRLAAEGLGASDVAVGVSASGSTPYVVAALEAALQVGALTALVSSNPSAPLGRLVGYHLAAETGPEALTGSTRLKAGTAAKLVLNSFSTALMVRLGHTYSNMMVEMAPTNSKLRQRTVRILAQATGAGEEACRRALSDAGDDLKVALVVMLAGVTPEAARHSLESAGGSVRKSLANFDLARTRRAPSAQDARGGP